MFKRFFGSKNRAEGASARPEAITALQALDQAILSIHPDRYFDDHDAAVEIQPCLVGINTFLNRPPTERFFPVEYGALMERAGYFQERGLLGQVLQAAKPLPAVYGLMLGVVHELRIRHNGERHDDVNFGREVQSSTESLISFLNRAASSRPAPMPPSR